MMYAFKETYESSFKIPVSTRKWLIDRYNKQKKIEHKITNPKSDDQDTSKPLTAKQKERFLKSKNI